jgi:hypothetical protein
VRESVGQEQAGLHQGYRCSDLPAESEYEQHPSADPGRGGLEVEDREYRQLPQEQILMMESLNISSITSILIKMHSNLIASKCCLRLWEQQTNQTSIHTACWCFYSYFGSFGPRVNIIILNITSNSVKERGDQVIW